MSSSTTTYENPRETSSPGPPSPGTEHPEAEDVGSLPHPPEEDRPEVDGPAASPACPLPSSEEVSAPPGTEADGFLLHDAAVEYAREGKRVLPLWPPGEDGSCTCGAQGCPDAGKHPIPSLVPRGVHDASDDPGVVAGWWTAHPGANIGYALRATEMILDVDGPEGEESLARMQAENASFAPTSVFRTGREEGGRQIIMEVPAGVRIPNVRGGEGILRPWPGLDVRSAGGYGILPPSRHKSRRRYEWISRGPVSGAPDWLVSLLTADSPSSRSRSAPTSTRTTRYGSAFLSRELGFVRWSRPGERHRSFFVAACRCGEVVASGELSRDLARSRLIRAGTEVGLPPRDMERAIDNAFARGEQPPRSPSRSTAEEVPDDHLPEDQDLALLLARAEAAAPADTDSPTIWTPRRDLSLKVARAHGLPPGIALDFAMDLDQEIRLQILLSRRSLKEFECLLAAEDRAHTREIEGLLTTLTDDGYADLADHGPTPEGRFGPIEFHRILSVPPPRSDRPKKVPPPRAMAGAIECDIRDAARYLMRLFFDKRTVLLGDEDIPARSSGNRAAVLLGALAFPSAGPRTMSSALSGSPGLR